MEEWGTIITTITTILPLLTKGRSLDLQSPEPSLSELPKSSSVEPSKPSTSAHFRGSARVEVKGFGFQVYCFRVQRLISYPKP